MVRGMEWEMIREGRGKVFNRSVLYYISKNLMKKAFNKNTKDMELVISFQYYYAYNPTNSTHFSCGFQWKRFKPCLTLLKPTGLDHRQF